MSEQGSTGEAPGGAAAEAVAKRARSRQARDKGLVEAARSGDNTAFGKLYDAWVDNVYDRAVNGGASAAEAREITEQTFLTAWRDLEKLKQPAAFGAKLMQVTRRETVKRVPDGPKLAPAPAKGGSSSPEERLSRATNAETTAADHDVAAVLREAATALDDKTREVLDLHFRQGLTRNETAAVLGEQPDKITETVTKLPPALAVLTRARVLWHGGKPDDPELADQLKQDGVTSFNAAAVRSINRFAKDNDRARARSLIGIPPIELYAAIPLADAPAGMKMAVASTLVTEGVPMDGSGFVKRDDKGEIIDQPKRVSKTRDVGAEKPSGAVAERSIRPGIEEKRPTLDTNAAAVAAAALAAEKQALEKSTTVAAAAPVEEKPLSRKDRKKSAAKADDAAAATAAAAAAAAAAEAKAKDAERAATSRPPDEDLPGRRDKGAKGAPTGDAAKAEEADKAAKTAKTAKAEKADQDTGGKGAADTAAAAAVGAAAGVAAAEAAEAEAEPVAAKGDGAAKADAKGAGTKAGAAGTKATDDEVGTGKGKSAGKGDGKGDGKKVAAAAAGAGAAAALVADGASAEAVEEGAKAAASKVLAEDTTVTPKAKAAATKPTPVVAPADEEAGGGGALKYVAAAVVAVLLLGGAAFAMTRGGDKKADVQAGPASSTIPSTTSTAKPATGSTTTTSSTVPTSSTEAPSTTAPEASSTTAASIAPPTTKGGVNPTVAPTAPPTIATTSTTSQSSTIVIKKFALDFYGQETDYSMTAPFAQHGAPTLSWEVTGNGELSATVTVTNSQGATTLVGTGLSNPGMRICPVPPTGDICKAPPGSYQYKIVVHPADGSADQQQAFPFVVSPH